MTIERRDGGWHAKILVDSQGPAGRLTTMEVRLPRFVLSEFNTHRQLSRNSASSRAIPVEKMIARVLEDPFIPRYWGKNQKGMQADVELTADEQALAVCHWLDARDKAVEAVRKLLALGVHKQIANRQLEPWLWHTIICSATEYANFFALRCHKDAQPEFRVAAVLMRECYRASEPVFLAAGDWHLPLCDDVDALRAEGFSTYDIARISAARCARVSYLTHEGKRDPQEDVAMASRLQAAGHMSPFEHAAMAELHDYSRVFNEETGALDIRSNFRGFRQLRKFMPNEAVFPGDDS